MKVRLHRELSEHIREGCEARLNVKINPYWFSIGSAYPDCTHHRFLHMHEFASAGDMVKRMMRRFCGKRIYSGQNLSRWRSLRLGIIMHYISDFLCYVHTPEFQGTLMEHRTYEVEQGSLSHIPQMKTICSFYGVENADELFLMLKDVIQSRESDSYSQSNDLDYALSVGVELAYVMLRICMGGTARIPLRFRVPYIGRFLKKRVTQF